MSIPLKDLSFSVRYMEAIEGLLLERGAPLTVLLNALGLTESQLHDPHQTIDGVQYQRAMVAALPYCLPGQSLAEQYLAHVPLTIIGPLAALLMACATVDDALVALEKYSTALFPAYRFLRTCTPSLVHVMVSRLSDFGEVDDLLTEKMLGLFAKYQPFLAEPLDGLELHFRHPQGVHPPLVPNSPSCKVFYGAGVDMVVFPKRLLRMALLTKSRVMQVESGRSLDVLLKRDEHARPFSGQVQRILRDLLLAGKVLHGDVVSDQMGMSRRTFNRRLEQEGTNLAKLISDVRMTHADTLLLTTTLPVTDIARRTGFSEVTNFSRAFKRVLGCTPRQRRDNAGALDGRSD
jgi:AraC-like DNA-binding protein